MIKTYKDSVDLVNWEELTNINNHNHTDVIKNIIKRLSSQDGGDTGTTTELNQCSFIEDKNAKADCLARIDDDDHGPGADDYPDETETTTKANQCSYMEDKEEKAKCLAAINRDRGKRLGGKTETETSTVGLFASLIKDITG